jgi:Fe-S-cluster-containing hydrogenase component 2
MIKVTGIPTLEQVKSKFPKEELLYKAKAIIECYQEIPCNPCSTSCPQDAISLGDDINNIPKIDYEKCTGCGMCVYSCPGLAISTCQINDDLVTFRIPYEMLPIPKKGETWYGINRSGKTICNVMIKSVLLNKNTDRTAVVAVEVPKQYLYDFITIRCKDE